MSMTKKEKATVEGLLIEAALRRTSAVEPDVEIPEFGGLSKGYLPVAETGDYPRVLEACSSSVYHGTDSMIKTTSQGPRRLYSTRLRALRALRFKVEFECAKRLWRVDNAIGEELVREAVNEPR
jgi:hypothetical protein